MVQAVETSGADRLALGDFLKEATSEVHRTAETRPLQKSLVGGSLPFGVLGIYLAQLYLVHEALESACQRCSAECPRLARIWGEGVNHRDRLLADLERHGIDRDSIEPLGSTSAVRASINRAAKKEPTALIGYFYVLEGSMNGNRFIARVLHQQHASEAPGGFSYFDPYGESQRQVWSEFKVRINACDDDAEVRTSIVTSALDMFEAIAALSDEVHQSANILSGEAATA